MSSSNLEKCSDDPCGRQVTLEASRLELLSRASKQGDLDAWATFQKSLEATVLTWLHAHPGSEVACRVHGERHLVSLAFERLRRAIIQGQVTCETLRNSKRPGAVSIIWSDGEDRLERGELWDRLQARLSGERERRLTHLLYHCGLEPAEIVHYCPLEWSDVQEVVLLRRIILIGSGALNPKLTLFTK